MPAIALPRGDPGQRGKSADDPRADHGRLRPHGEHIRRDADERAQLADQPGHAEHTGEQKRTGGDERDVLTGDGQ